MDGPGFLAAHNEINVAVPTHTVEFDDNGWNAALAALQVNDRRPLLRLVQADPVLRHEAFHHYLQLTNFHAWARELSRYEATYIASVPLAAYLSGRPYCIFSVGGDLQVDCGRGDGFGQAMSVAFNAGRFLMISNPHAVGHSRRLGLTNGVYLPYPMDDHRYSPGHGEARARWVARCGEGTYVLATARIDHKVKGIDDSYIDALAAAAQREPSLRFVFLTWGHDAQAFRQRVMALPVAHQFLLLEPVGKRRLVDYYRSCDVVLDQMVYGYFGATALEAASVGKPLVMRLRQEQYASFYQGDTAPVCTVDSPAAVRDTLVSLAQSPEKRRQLGDDMRAWLVRHHGRERTLPLLLSMLRVAADQVKLPPELVSPLLEPLSQEELSYHRSCLITEPVKASR